MSKAIRSHIQFVYHQALATARQNLCVGGHNAAERAGEVISGHFKVSPRMDYIYCVRILKSIQQQFDPDYIILDPLSTAPKERCRLAVGDAMETFKKQYHGQSYLEWWTALKLAYRVISEYQLPPNLHDLCAKRIEKYAERKCVN